MEVSNDRESHRAMKRYVIRRTRLNFLLIVERIRTQSALVQHSEQQLEDQQQHCEYGESGCWKNQLTLSRREGHGGVPSRDEIVRPTLLDKIVGLAKAVLRLLCNADG